MMDCITCLLFYDYSHFPCEEKEAQARHHNFLRDILWQSVKLEPGPRFLKFNFGFFLGGGGRFLFGQLMKPVTSRGPMRYFLNKSVGFEPIK